MIRINAQAIGVKNPVQIDEKTRKVKATFEYQKNVLQRSQPKGKNTIERAINDYEVQIESTDEMIQYIADMLDLNSKQVEKLNNANFPKVVALSDQIVRKMLHYDEGNNDPKAGKK